MNRRLALSIGLGTLFVVRAASAQDVTVGYQGLPYKYSGDSQNSGVQVSDGVLMHVGAGAEVGYDSNVFYTDPSGPVVSSGIVRITSYAEITNATRSGATPSGLFFDARAGLMYRRYTSDAVTSPNQDAFNPSAGLALSTSISSAVSVGFADAFIRLEEAPYIANQQPITRDNNQASAEIRWAPGGGRINTVLRYTNMVDIFTTNNYSYANSLTQELMLDGSWKWLPKTAVFFQARQGWISYLADTPNPDAPKVSSYPLRVVVGLRGLITEKTTALLSAGYVNGFYSCGSITVGCVDTNGSIWGSTTLNAELTYRPTLLSRIVLGYRHDFQNAVISTFYYGESAYASFVQQFAGRLALDLSGRYQRQNYQGFVSVPAGGGAPVDVPRVDNIFQVGATLDYFLRNWAYLGVGYALLANDSNPSEIQIAGQLTPLNYTKNQVFARLGATY
jgi:hypothetical protein